jgi:hypothetical protein
VSTQAQRDAVLAVEQAVRQSGHLLPPHEQWAAIESVRELRLLAGMSTGRMVACVGRMAPVRRTP